MCLEKMYFEKLIMYDYDLKITKLLDLSIWWFIIHNNTVL